MKYFLIISFLIVLIQLLTLPTPLRAGGSSLRAEGSSGPEAEPEALRGEELGEGQTKAQLKEETPLKEEVNIEERWGITILSIRLSASDYMLDFRYRVIDPEKAHMFTQKQIKPYLIDQATGKKLPVARTRLGPMRQTAVTPVSGRNYAILFGNTNKVVKVGSKVTVVIGDFKAENLTVE